MSRIRPPKCCDREPTPNDVARFLRMVKVDAATGCWVWQGHKDDKGYGQFRFGRMHWAHRVAWLFFRGPIPRGKTIHHKSRGPKCLNPSCCNPRHLRPLSNGENAAQGNRTRNRECPL